MMREGCDDHHKVRRRGGVGQEKPKDFYSTRAVDGVKSQLEEKTGVEYESLEVLKYRRQVVAGFIYITKVKARTVDGSESIMHLRIWSKQFHKEKSTELTGYQDNKTEDDELVPFRAPGCPCYSKE